MKVQKNLKKCAKKISSFCENIKKNGTSKNFKYYMNGKKIINAFLNLNSKISFFILLINFENTVQKFNWIKNFLELKKQEKQIRKVCLGKKQNLKKTKLPDYSSKNFAINLTNSLEKNWASRIVDWQEDQIKTKNSYDLNGEFFENFPIINVSHEKKTTVFYKKAKIILKKKVSQKISNLKNSASRNKKSFFQKYKFFLNHEKIPFKKEEFLNIKIKTLELLNFKIVEEKKSFEKSKSQSSGNLIKKNKFLKDETLVGSLSFKNPFVSQILYRDLFYQRPEDLINKVGFSSQEKLLHSIQKKPISKAPVLISTYFLNKKFKTDKIFGNKMPIIFKFIHFRTKLKNWTKQFNPLGDIFIFGGK